MTHHQTRRRRSGLDGWEIARPLRDTSWWRQWRRERACRKAFGCCWHPDEMGMIGWWCCMCSGEIDGMPPQRCAFCTAKPAPITLPQECQGADFSKLVEALAEGLTAHADRDGLAGVRRAVFLSRGGHAPGTACLTGPPADPHEYWCAAPDDECTCGARR